VCSKRSSHNVVESWSLSIQGWPVGALGKTENRKEVISMFRFLANRHKGCTALDCVQQLRSRRGKTQGVSLLQTAENAIHTGNVGFAVSSLEKFQLVAVDLSPEDHALVQLGLQALRLSKVRSLLKSLGFRVVAGVGWFLLREWGGDLLNFYAQFWVFEHKLRTFRMQNLLELASCLGVAEADLLDLANKAPRSYRGWWQRKKDGGFRPVREPSPDLKRLQWKLLDFITRIPYHPILYGGPNTSARMAALPHRGQPVVVALDIKDFFPSVKAKEVREEFLRLGYSPSVAAAITRLVTYKNRLPQGAPTSPAVARL